MLPPPPSSLPPNMNIHAAFGLWSATIKGVCVCDERVCPYTRSEDKIYALARLYDAMMVPGKMGRENDNVRVYI